jgi:hypothetical protein
MSKWNRPMRAYKPEPVICFRCSKPLLSSQAIEWIGNAPAHATNCMAPPTREAYAARVAAKRAARRAGMA